MADAHPAKTPAKPGPICIEEEVFLSPEDTKFFRSAKGSLLHLNRGTRPNITHPVMVLAKPISEYGPRAMTKRKGVLRYLKGTSSIGRTHGEDANDGDKLTAYVDSDHAGDQNEGCSTTGFGLYLAGDPVEWRSIKRRMVAISTVEAEDAAMSKVRVMVSRFRNLLESMKEKQEQAIVTFEDDSSAVSLSRSATISLCTKHIDVKFNRVRSLVADGVVDVTYVKLELQRADVLNRILGVVKFLTNPLLLLGVCTPSLSEIRLMCKRFGRCLKLSQLVIC